MCVCLFVCLFLYNVLQIKAHSLFLEKIIGECYTLFLSAEKADIDLGLVSLRHTTMKNVLAITTPWLPASFRAQLDEGDSQADFNVKLKLAVRNFRVSTSFLVCSDLFIRLDSGLTFILYFPRFETKKQGSWKHTGASPHGMNIRRRSLTWPCCKVRKERRIK